MKYLVQWKHALHEAIVRDVLNRVGGEIIAATSLAAVVRVPVGMAGIRRLLEGMDIEVEYLDC